MFLTSVCSLDLMSVELAHFALAKSDSAMKKVKKIILPPFFTDFMVSES